MKLLLHLRSPEPQHGEPGQTEPDEEEEGSFDVGDRGGDLQPVLAALPDLLPGQHGAARHQPVQVHQPDLPGQPLARHEQQLLQPLHLLPLQPRVQTRVWEPDVLFYVWSQCQR